MMSASFKISEKDKQLHQAALEGQLEELLRAVREGANVNVVLDTTSDRLSNEDSGEVSALYGAICNGRDNTASFLLKKHAKGSKKLKLELKNGQCKRTALHIAAAKGNLVITEKLLDYGAAIDVGDDTNWTPLHVAAFRHREDIVRLLIARGANLDIQTTDSHKTALFLATQLMQNTEQTTEVAALLLENGASPNIQNTEGLTPLHNVVEHGQKGLMTLLLQNGADALITNNDGETARGTADMLTSGDENLNEILDNPPVRALKQGPENYIRQKPPAEPSETRREVCRKFLAHIKYYHDGASKSRNASVHDVLYDDELLKKISAEAIKDLYDDSCIELETLMEKMKEQVESAAWKWIHLPANNATWAKDLIKRLSFIQGHSESSCKDILDFIDKCFYEHKGSNTHSYFRRPTFYAQALPSSLKAARSVSTAAGSTTAEDSIDASLTNDNLGWVEKSGEEKRCSIASMKFTGQIKEDEDGSGDRISERFSKNLADVFKNLTDVLKDVSAKQSKRGSRRLSMSTVKDGQSRFSLVIPYIDVETQEYLDRSDLTKGYLGSSDLPGKKQQFPKMNSLMKEYGGYSGLHVSRTLDQYYYETLDDTSARDRDQVVYRYTERRHPKVPEQPGQGKKMTLTEKEIAQKRQEVRGRQPTSAQKDKEQAQLAFLSARTMSSIRRENQQQSMVDGNVHQISRYDENQTDRSRQIKILMVNQLWLWKIDERTIITSFPERWHQGAEKTLLNSINDEDTITFSSPEELVEHIVYRCVTFTEEPFKSGLDEHFLDIFANEIAKISDAETKCYEGFKTMIEEMSRRPEQTGSKARLPRRDFGTPEISIMEEISLLREIKDIRDELNILHRVLNDQRDVIDKLAHHLNWHETRHFDDFMRASGLKSREDRIEKLKGDAQRVQDSLDHLLNMKQAQISIVEAEYARLQGQYIFAFTLVTIIFAPLSFIAALFALQIKDYPHNGQGIELTRGWVGKYMTAGEFASLVLVGVIAFCVLRKNYILRVLRNGPPSTPKWIKNAFNISMDGQMPPREDLGQAQRRVPWLRPRRKTTGNAEESKA